VDFLFDTVLMYWYRSINMRIKKYTNEVVDSLTDIHDPVVMFAFLKDLLTPAELDDVVLRLQIIKMLRAGTPQREIAKKLGISIAKVTRGSRALQETTLSKKQLQDFYDS